jgi:peptidoglycan/xylan/chitin deacetylase (PgdA/CDA1 family)
MQQLIKRLLMILSSIIKRNRKSKILYYHDVYGENKYTDMGTTLDMFTKHIKTIRDLGFNIKPKIENPENEVMICFDDGFKGIYDTRHFFIKNNLCPTVFLSINLIGTTGYLNQKEILELQNKGFRFQCHAWSHSDLTTFSKNDLERELFESKKKLTDLLGETIDEICFPIGYFSQLVLDECRRYGYKTMYSSIPGNYFDQIYIKELRSRNLVQFADTSEVKSVLLGGYELIKGKYIKMHWKN